MTRRVLMAEVSGGRVRGRPRLGLMDDVKVALGCASMCERKERVENPGTYVTERVSRGHFCISLCSFGLPCCAVVVITWRVVGCQVSPLG